MRHDSSPPTTTKPSFSVALVPAAFAALVLAACATSGEQVPAERTAIFPAARAPDLIQAVCYIAPKDLTGYWTPTAQDLVGIEQSLPEFLRAQKWREKPWTDFYRQAAGVMRGEERFILLSYFVRSVRPPGDDAGADPQGWKTATYWVNDGGDWFFRVLYDVAQGKFVWYESNNQD